MAVRQTDEEVLSFGWPANSFEISHFIIEDPLSFQFSEQVVDLNLVVFGEQDMGVEDFHSVAFEPSRDFSIRTVFKTLFGSNVNEQSFILEHSQLVLEEGNHFD